MQRSTRLNDMMVLLSDRQFFNLSDLMDAYAISKSTALRDVRALQEIGMPIYSEAGRHGRYGILKNRLLSPIIFTVDEMEALYFAMLALGAFESTPFDLSVESLRKKFESCLSERLVATLGSLERVLSFEGTRHRRSSPLLGDILHAAVEGTVCRISYRKDGVTTTTNAQILSVSTSFGQWYATGFDHERQRMRVFRCDRVAGIAASARYDPLPREELVSKARAAYRTADATDFEVQVADAGVDLFYKESYPSMELVEKGGRHLIHGFYNAGEERFIADYLIAYGTLVESVDPPQLAALIRGRLDELARRYARL